MWLLSKRDRALNLVRKNLRRFEDLAGKLSEASSKCEESIVSAQKAIERQQATIAVHSKAKEQSSILVSNMKALLTKKVVTEETPVPDETPVP